MVLKMLYQAISSIKVKLNVKIWLILESLLDIYVIETPGWSKWSTWFACTASCGSGTQIRRRFCDGGNPGSNVCPGMRIEEMQFCNTGRCPYWSEWSAWSVCSKSCDEGREEVGSFNVTNNITVIQIKLSFQNENCQIYNL